MFNCKKTVAVLSTAALAMSFSFASMAAANVSSVSLTIDSDIAAGDSDSDVEVTASSSKYTVDDVDVTNEPGDEWEDGDKPKLKVTVSSADNYSFSSGFSKSSVDLSGDDGTVTSVTRSSSSKLYVYITLDALDDDDSDYELDVSNLEWDEDTGEASWDEAEDAKRYEVKLYRNDSTVTSVTATDESYDFSGSITKKGTYTFKVRAVYNSSNKGSWEESDEWDVSSSEAEDISSGSSGSSSSGSSSSSGPGGSSLGAWLKDNVGWWYCNADRSYTVNNWQYINNKWYFFNGNGYMVTGWVYWNSIWYYCGENGDMYVNRTTPDGYYVNGDGAWVQ